MHERGGVEEEVWAGEKSPRPCTTDRGEAMVSKSMTHTQDRTRLLEIGVDTGGMEAL
jgi:hypothetical protein